MKVVLIAEERPYPPLALGYIKAYAEEKLRGRVSIEILYVKEYGDIFRLKRLSRVFRSDLVGFSCYGDLSVFSPLARRIKERSGGRTRVVVGGPMVPRPPLPRQVAPAHIDYLVIGEGEETFLRLLTNLSAGRGAEGIEGLAYLDGGKYAVNPLRAPLKPSLIPSPYLKDVFDVKKFSEFYIDDARGCAFACNYCAQSVRLERERKFPLPRVFGEVRYILERAKTAHGLTFNSSDFFLDRDRAMKILPFLNSVRGDRGTVFNVTGNAFFLDDRLAALLKGGYEIGFGVQSLRRSALRASNRLLDMEKTVGNIRKYGERLIEQGNSFSLSFIYGLPGDDPKSFSKAVDFAVSAAPAAHFYPLSVFPHTYFGAHAGKFGLVARPEYPFLSVRSCTYTRSGMRRTEKMLADISPALAMSSGNRFLRRFLLLLAERLKGDNRYLRAYSGFSSWLARRKTEGSSRPVPLIPDGVMDFAGRVLGGSGGKGLRSLRRFAEISAARLAFRERGAHLRDAAENVLKKMRPRGGPVLSLVWSDFAWAGLPGDITLFLSDAYTDDRVRRRPGAEPLSSAARAIGALRRGGFPAVLLPLVWTSAGEMKGRAEFLRSVCGRVAPGGCLIFIDHLSPGDVSFILKNCGRRAAHGVISPGGGNRPEMHVIKMA